MSLAFTADVHTRIATLVGEVAYGGTKEAIRVLLAACLAVVMTNPRPGSWAERLKMAGAVLLLCLAAFLLAVRVAAYVYDGDADDTIRSLLFPWIASPPPPPPLPPLMQLAESTRAASRKAIGFARKHPFQLVGAFGALVLADLLNVAITIDRLDPLVRLAQFTTRPLVRVARWAYRAAMRQRARAAMQVASTSISTRGRAATTSAGSRGARHGVRSLAFVLGLAGAQAVHTPPPHAFRPAPPPSFHPGFHTPPPLCRCGGASALSTAAPCGHQVQSGAIGGTRRQSTAPTMAAPTAYAASFDVATEWDSLFEGEDDEWEPPPRRSFKPVLLGRALAVSPLLAADAEAQPPRPPSGATQLRLLDGEGGNVFLTTSNGRLHASTLMILSECLARRAELCRAKTALDYGCGSGVLALGALALGHPDLVAYATDVSEAALSCARRNGVINGVGSRRLRAALPWEVPRRLSARGADWGMANMLPGPLISVEMELATRLRPGALLLLSGFRQRDVPAVRAAFEGHFEVPDEPTSERDDGWLMLACRRREGGVDVASLSDSAVE